MATSLLLRIALAVALLQTRPSPTAAQSSPLRDSLAALAANEDVGYWRASSRRLARLPLADFGPAEREALAGLLLRPPVARAPALIRLAGGLQLASALRQMRGAVTLSADVEQVRRAALVRAGDAGEAEIFGRAIRSLPVDEDFVREVLPVVLYARHRPSVDYLWAELSVPNLTCRSLDPDSETAIDCGYRLMEGLATVVEGFPVAPTWDGGVDADDYPAALARVRAWYRAHANTYTLTRDRL